MKLPKGFLEEDGDIMKSWEEERGNVQEEEVWENINIFLYVDLFSLLFCCFFFVFFYSFFFFFF